MVKSYKEKETGSIRETADGIITKTPHYWKLSNDKEYEDGRLGSRLGVDANLPGGFSSALALSRRVEISVSQQPPRPDEESYDVPGRGVGALCTHTPKKEHYSPERKLFFHPVLVS